MSLDAPNINALLSYFQLSPPAYLLRQIWVAVCVTLAIYVPHGMVIMPYRFLHHATLLPHLN
jgi:hypothetical protein